MEPQPGPSWASDPSQILMSMVTESRSPSKEAHVAAQAATGLIASFHEEDVIDAEDLLPVDEITAGNDLQKFVRGEISYNELERKMDDEVLIPATQETATEEEVEGDDDFDEFSLTKRGRRSKLDEITAGLLGNAELSFARGNHKDAILMVMEVIKTQPLAYEPYQTLGDFYEQLSQDDKALQYFTIAAYLCPSDGENWKYVAEKHLEQGSDPGTAIKYYDRAIRLIPLGADNIECRMNRAKIFEEDLKYLPKAIEGYEAVLSMCQENDGEFAVDLAKKVARLHFENNDLSSSIRVLETNFSKYESYIVSENVNMYIELLITQRDICKALVSFQRYCGTKFFNQKTDKLMEDMTPENIARTGKDIKVDLPFAMPIDLLTKLIVCLIHLEAKESLDKFQAFLLNESAESTGDLYLDVAEAHIEKKAFDQAEIFLKKLVETQTYGCEGAVWLRFARVLKELKKTEESIEGYFKVISFEPNHFDARLELSQQLVSQNRFIEAAEVSGRTVTSEGFINLDLLFVKCQLLFRQKKYSDFIEAAKTFLASDMILLQEEKEVSCMISPASFQRKMECLKEVHKEMGLDVTDQRCSYIGSDPSPEAYFEILIKMCHVLANVTNDQMSLKRLVFSAYTSQSLLDKESSLDFLALMTCYRQKDKEYCYRVFKSVVFKIPTNNQVWNVFCPIVSCFYQDLRHNRFCLRLFIKHPDLLPLAFFNGHNALMSGSYKHALAEYVNIHKQRPGEAFPVFCMAIAFLHIASQRFTHSKNSLVVQLCAFVDLYISLRGECQESLYNTGRIFHQIGLLSNAADFYKKALDCPVSVEVDRSFDLRAEIGYNLSYLYKSSGSPELSLYYRNKYCIA